VLLRPPIAWFLFALSLITALSMPGVVLAQGGLDAPEPVGAFLDGVFPSLTPGTTPGGTWGTQNALPNLVFSEPVRIVEHPLEDQLVIASKTGPIWLVDNDPATTVKTLFLDLSSRTNYPGTGEGGITGFAFHPDFGDGVSAGRGYVYVHYRFSPDVSGQTSSGELGYNVLSRFTVPDGQGVADPASELVLIQQYDRQQWHIGGDLFFGADGFLYMTVGDEGNCCGREDSTQRIDGGLWSGILRLDVDNDPAKSHPICRQPLEAAEIASAGDSATNPRPAGWVHSFTQNYGIPNDNPFVDPGCNVLEEFYSIGLRHPWTFQRDPQTNEIWYADVGQGAREEIGRSNPGDNHQWGYLEGTDVNGPIATPDPIVGNARLPIADYDHGVGAAVIGAGVYRGQLYPELFGKYLFSDFIEGDFWAVDALEQGPFQIRNEDAFPVPEIEKFMTLPAGFGAGINSFAMVRDGHILMAKTAGGANANGTILELVRQGTPTPQPPQFLSQTGAFSDLANLVVRSGCIPYDLVVPFWSDTAVKTRWICLPNDGTHDTPGEKIAFSEEGEWEFPVGTVLIKHFELPIDEGDPLLTQRLETRFLVHAVDGWYAVTYRWIGGDAELLFDGADEDITVTALDDSTFQQTWRYPSRGECLTCHVQVSLGSLGPNTRQWNRDAFYPVTSRTANQLLTFDELGMLDPAIGDPNAIAGFLTSTPTDDTAAPISDRARSYLDSNCGYCHQPGGVRANFDARLTTPIQSSGILFGALAEPLGIPGEAVIVPGHPEQSVAYLRANSVGQTFSMPPLAKSRIDAAAMPVIEAWIQSLALRLGNDTSTDGAFIDGHHPSLYVNEADTFTNSDVLTTTVTLSLFRFYAQRPGNPITPLVVRVEGDNAFTVLAIGTTRSSAEYAVGENVFAFDGVSVRTLDLAPGETIATGFMDALPDGSGWGAGTVIPADSGGGEDEIWALLPSPLIDQTSPYDPARDTAAVVEGEDPLVTNAGKALSEFTGLTRSYRFAVDIALGDGTGTPPPVNQPPAVTPPGNPSSLIGDVIALQIVANDAEGDPLSFGATGLPSGLVISPAGLVSGTTTTAGVFSVAVQVDDGINSPVQLDFTWSVFAPGSGGVAPFSLGSDEAHLPGSTNDGWPHNLYVREGDPYINTTAQAQSIAVATFRFYASEQSDPVTPFVVKVNGDDDFTVVAVGTPRLASEYGVGANSFAFADGVAPVVDVLPGESLASGFLDALPDGSYPGGYTPTGNPIPNDGHSDPEGDENWFTGGPNVADASGQVIVGQPPVPGTQVNLSLSRDYHYAIDFEPADVGFDFVVGNDTSSPGADADSWSSNLVVNETDTYTNATAGLQNLAVTSFEFHSHAEDADPVTPFVVRVDGNDSFSVLAIGTTRTGGDYALGENAFVFAEAGDPIVTLVPGETLAIGFLDAHPDGSGGGAGSVVSADFSTGDEIWYTGGSAGTASGAVAVGAPPTPGSQTILTLNRDYRFAMAFRFEPINVAPTLVDPGDQAGVVDDGVALQLVGGDDDFDPLGYAATGLPDGLAIDPETGLISGTLASAGEFVVSASVDDGVNPPVVVVFSWSVDPPPDPGAIVLGNPGGGGASQDTWVSNLYVNETDTYTNLSGVSQIVRANDFDFYAGVSGLDPVTPFLVVVNGPDEFSVVAIGTPRSDYLVGDNSYPFAEGGAPTLLLLPGQTLATGFLDALPDGTGGGLGNPIPKPANDDPINGDELWFTGGESAADSGSVALGEAPAQSATPGAVVMPSLKREYRYSVGLTVEDVATVPLGGWIRVLVVAGVAFFGGRARRGRASPI
jgi:uncharacterized repeat protein (TIGR03806 family)